MMNLLKKYCLLFEVLLSSDRERIDMKTLVQITGDCVVFNADSLYTL